MLSVEPVFYFVGNAVPLEHNFGAPVRILLFIVSTQFVKWYFKLIVFLLTQMQVMGTTRGQKWVCRYLCCILVLRLAFEFKFVLKMICQENSCTSHWIKRTSPCKRKLATVKMLTILGEETSWRHDSIEFSAKVGLDVQFENTAVLVELFLFPCIKSRGWLLDSELVCQRNSLAKLKGQTFSVNLNQILSLVSPFASLWFCLDLNRIFLNKFFVNLRELLLGTIFGGLGFQSLSVVLSLVANFGWQKMALLF